MVSLVVGTTFTVFREGDVVDFDDAQWWARLKATKM